MNRVKNILQDKLLKNFLNIFSGDALASLFSIISVSFITKGIGVEKYGYIVLIQGVVALIDGVFNFQSWQGFIKFFPEIKGDRERLKELIKFSYFLDIVTAFIAFLVLNLGSRFIGKIYNFNREQLFLMIIFSLYILFNIQGTPIGVLRSFNRFDLLRNQRIITSIYNFIMLGIGFFFKLNLNYFIFIFLTTNILNGVLINIYTMLVLKNSNLLGFFKAKFRFDKEFFKFTCLTNINSSLDIPVQYFDNLLIGKMLSLEQLGIYKICKTIAIVLDKIGTPIYQTLYPYFCEMIRENKKREIVKKFLVVSSILSVICFCIIGSLNIFGFYLLERFFSELVGDYKFQINLYLLMRSLGTIFIAIHPLFLALGYIKVETKIIFIANIIYMIALFKLINYFNLTGVIVAYGVQVSLILIMKSWYIFRR
ncbi:MAG: lipopolysaccharide biosynthesis protein [Fusobacterium sp.]|jgi:O-antigen/teichoic acid export membrane protein|uniref:lipopolysaccharide biosynthesis protein n=1 Tax=Fusobacterium sp. TaxID=68766 RepID=UPI002942273A|nr:lipopolysaccharide biosynthesis protein [Fusobacterium sp.]MDY3058530.1 lipopolysaccharide biosynthesis protein [Fusobacterium sp.]MEE1475196.1 lipopolysaccharide biosynthesis protein [Fusobacterium sp.]